MAKIQMKTPLVEMDGDPVKSAVKGAGNSFPAGKFRPVPFCHVMDNRALRQKVACGKQACRADNHRRRLSYLPQYFRQ